MSDDSQSTIDSFMAEISLPSSIPTPHHSDFDTVDPVFLEMQNNMIEAVGYADEMAQVIRDEILPQMEAPTPEVPSVIFSFPSIDVANISDHLDVNEDIGEPVHWSTPKKQDKSSEPARKKQKREASNIAPIWPLVTINDTIVEDPVIEVINISDSTICNSELKNTDSDTLKELYADANEALDLLGTKLKKLKNFKRDRNYVDSEDEAIDTLIAAIENKCDKL